jgi:hypothetical protein
LQERRRATSSIEWSRADDRVARRWRCRDVEAGDALNISVPVNAAQRNVTQRIGQL